MPPFTVDNFQKIIQNIAVLETKVHWIEVHVEVNGLCGNDNTFPWNQSSSQEPANTWLISSNNDTQKTIRKGMRPNLKVKGYSDS